MKKIMLIVWVVLLLLWSCDSLLVGDGSADPYLTIDQTMDTASSDGGLIPIEPVGFYQTDPAQDGPGNFYVNESLSGFNFIFPM
jgi:hypothetical protein